MVHYGEPETPRNEPRQPIGSIGALPQDSAGWIGGPVPAAVTWIGMPATQGWIGGAPAVQDTWIGAEQSRPQRQPLPDRSHLQDRDLVRIVERGRTGRPVDRAKLPPFLQAHPRFRGQGD